MNGEYLTKNIQVIKNFTYYQQIERIEELWKYQNVLYE